MTACYGCGLILEENGYLTSKSYPFEVPLEERELHENEIYEELQSRGVISEELKNLCYRYLRKWDKENIPLKKNHKAFCLYYCSRILKFPISLHEISYFFNIPKKEICKPGKFFKDIEDIPASFFIEKLALKSTSKRIPYSKIKEMKEKADKCEKIFCVNPSILAAAIISLENKIKVKELAALSFITPASISKWRKEVKRVFD